MREADEDQPARTVGFRFNGRAYEAREGESLAAALLRAGVYGLTDAADDQAPRGAFCWMGWCQECRVLQEGRSVEACRLPVREGLEARSREPLRAR